VVLDGPTTLPEGTVVEVRAVEPTSRPAPPSLYERYKSFIGAAEGLPEDLADEHDHSVHGTPKRSEPAPPGGPTIWEKLLELEGTAELPPDAARKLRRSLNRAKLRRAPTPRSLFPFDGPASMSEVAGSSI
jgi:hypothetical protein